ncbi:MAG TPA: redoxin domain-containing protein [Actinophytocola sp.]|uniref:redoxin domain-containing protein n=1 Tax=Actinophytocola sp. TaxID=1872138 RepID=UPI002DBBF4F7|nr:redoxin domain-containing protein [Actinophytocola sp.]HEU5474488.1 redoxin domain-containing protein [Actinophytocola sp.]
MRRAFPVICTAVLLTGCGAANQPRSTEVRQSQVVISATASGSARVIPAQLAFTGKTVDGQDFAGADLAGTPAVLWFWAPWCPKCQGEAEDIAKVAKENEGSVKFVGVAAQDEVPAMRAFIEEYGLGSFPHIADTEARVWQRFGVYAQPAYAFISADGTIDLQTRQLQTDDLNRRVRALAG